MILPMPCAVPGGTSQPGTAADFGAPDWTLVGLSAIAIVREALSNHYWVAELRFGMVFRSRPSKSQSHAMFSVSTAFSRCFIGIFSSRDRHLLIEVLLVLNNARSSAVLFPA